MEKAAGLILLTLFVCGPVFAQGTEKEREDCTPDAMRLCGQFIPDAGRIETCLRNAGPRLSPACYAVFYPPRAMNQARPGPPSRRALPPPSRDTDDDED